MISAIKTAVILAAGMGTRLKDHTKEMPKGFLEIDGQTLIERSIDNLLNQGITEIIIGTGYFHEHFDELRSKYPGIVTFRNEDFATTGSMYTLYVLRHLIRGPFLLLESDLLYDPVALKHVLSDPIQDIILASGPTQSGDEVFIQFSKQRFLQNMSKDRTLLRQIDAELVGISKLSVEALRHMVAFAENQFKQGRKMINYEDAMVGSVPQYNIFIKRVDDLVWCEIDDENHLERALTKIYPRIPKRNR